MFEANQDTFQRSVLAESFSEPVVVLFHAEWCGPCKMLKPLIERLAIEYAFMLVGVDGGEQRALATSQKVRGVPTVAVYSKGEQVATLVGGKGERELRAFLLGADVTQNKLEL